MTQQLHEADEFDLRMERFQRFGFTADQAFALADAGLDLVFVASSAVGL